MDNSQYYPPRGHQRQATNMPNTPDCQQHQATIVPNMPPNYVPSGGPPYHVPPPGFRPASHESVHSHSVVQGNVDDSSLPSFWPGQNVYQPPQPQNGPPWTLQPAPPGQANAVYGCPPPPPQSSAGYPFSPPPPQGGAGYGCPPTSYPHLPSGFESQGAPPVPPQFDQHGPPLGFREPQQNQISAFVEAQRNALSVPQHPTFQSHDGGPTNQWAPVPTPSQSGIRDESRRHVDNQRNFGCTVSRSFGVSSGKEGNRWPAGSNEVFSKQNEPILLSPKPEPLDEDSIQRTRDERWLDNFLSKRRAKSHPLKVRSETLSVSQMKEGVYGTLKLVSDLSSICQTLKENLENDALWTESHNQAVELMHNIKENMNVLTDPEAVLSIKKKLATTLKKRVRTRRRKRERFEDEQKREEKVAERHAAIDAWRMRRIRQVEEKKREEELKVAADAVMSEVRKKQGDAKKMLDILKALEKLRKLRKEAAARKGVYPEPESDQVFEGHLTRLRALIGKRTALYAVEEKALSVMLEGEQEEERKRDVEKRQRKEREKLLHKRRQVEVMLFGDAIPSDHPLQAFQDFYLQAESSLPALVQVRREWDQFLCPDGSTLPQAWVLPEAPADEAWAMALEKHISLPD